MKKYIVFALLITGNLLFAQEQATGNLVDYINNIIDDIPRGKGTGEYQKPSPEQLNDFSKVITNIVEEKYSDASLTAADFGYKLIEFTDQSDNEIYYLLERNSTNYWGTFIFSKKPKRKKIVIQSPHPVYDSNTGKQCIAVYKNVGAFAFFMSGTHRCNSSQYSTCSGQTSACGSEENYRISDQAHNVDNTFQTATEVLIEKIDSLIFIQLHGFAKGDDDPHLIMSNGVASTPAGIDYLSLLKNELLEIDSQLTFKIAHIDSWTKLIATTNVQGRLINGSSNPCNQSASFNSGQFIHIEQSFERLRNSESNRLKMATAIASVFPEDNVTSIEAEQTEPINTELTFYPNPFNSSMNIVFNVDRTSHVKLELYDILGKRILQLFNDKVNYGSYSIMLNGDNLVSGVYFLVMRTDKNLISRKVLYLK